MRMRTCMCGGQMETKTRIDLSTGNKEEWTVCPFCQKLQPVTTQEQDVTKVRVAALELGWSEEKAFEVAAQFGIFR